MSPGPVVLLVEDDFLLRDALRLLLEDAGYDVVPAATGGEALACARERPPGVVVLDLGLPDRSGLDVVRALRRREATRATPVMALTGRAGTAERQACLEAGCTEYHAKPLRPALLLRRIAALLGTAGAEEFDG